MRRIKSIFPIRFNHRILAVMVMLFSCQMIIGQIAYIEVIDLYGLRKVKEADIRQALRIRVGDSLDLNTFTKKDIVARMQEVQGVEKADIGLVCCYGKEEHWILYAGISENQKDSFPFHSAPGDSMKLPSEMIRTSERQDSAIFEAVQKGDAGEDDSQGYALWNNAAVRSCQEDYIRYARKELPILKKVLYSSSNGEQRAIAAEIMAYSDNKKEVVVDLLYAIHDPDANVRNNATRALGIMAEYAFNNKGTGIYIPADDFIQMIHSVVWTDRNKGISVLSPLTAGRDSTVLAQLRHHSLPELTEMARWTSLGHAVDAFVILGRIASFKDPNLEAGMSLDERLDMVSAFLKVIH